ncbi:ABC transporter substrate binding protein [Propionispora hippei]|uniref:Diguanylate cyclase (GGDEF) domain-containing protein n=1 Tax=Propionispora hippei DSM 15287 TaxID=1123003 RepID=A0A1M6ISP6_9FIRM|nr:ABC transporter substrate binding protein [Propionispora hippei]SHJ37349.1 diguanylate cyclase (GGDEF) domain-containing protein [Propionispora hippei DSM 15287]
MKSAKARKSIACLIIFIIGSMLFAGSLSWAKGRQESRNILILNSYHKGYRWTDDIMEGIFSVLGPEGQQLHLTVEDMDTKRVAADQEYFNKLYEVYRYKFKDRKFDLVICSDDAAFHFLEQFHQQLFPDTPVVFCGVNYFEDGMLKDQPLFTGVVEMYDIRGTIQAALRLHPATKNIYVINDKTITGQGVRRTLLEVTKEFPDVNFISLEDLPMAEIQDKVRQLSADSLVLFLVFFQDTAGDHFNYDESISLIAAGSRVPIYGVWDFYLGHGIVGGVLTSGYSQGAMAAQLALRVLAGEQPAHIPPVKDNVNRAMFDERQMKRYGIDRAQLPEGSTIINESYTAKKQVLVLQSYHSDMPWVHSVDTGVRAVLGAEPDVECYFDYMDTKRNPSPEYLQQLYDLYKYKYGNKKFDAIITVDDNAYHFVLTHHQEIFPGTPMAFCGVNDFNEQVFAANHNWVSGVVENVNIPGTLDVALRLHPRVRNIVVINDHSGVGQTNLRMLRDSMPPYQERGIHFDLLDDMTMAEVRDYVSRLGDDSLILLLTFNQDKANHVFSYEESMDLIAEKAKVPIYGLWDFYLNHGLVGGFLTDGYSQGELAATLALRMLRGEAPGQIPVVRQSPNNYMFDYRQLVRFGVDLQKLPPGSMVLNQPASFYGQYRTLVWGVGLFIFLLVIAICFLYVNIIGRKKVEQELKVHATTDTMTGVINRRTGLLFLEEQLVRADEAGKPCTICFIDINDLKRVNDQWGHHQGDRLIETVCLLIKEALRPADILARLGGDEFLIIFPSCTIPLAALIWQSIATQALEYNKTESYFQVSLSHGFAQYNPGSAVSSNELIKEADFCMYQDKMKQKGIIK